MINYKDAIKKDIIIRKNKDEDTVIIKRNWQIYHHECLKYCYHRDWHYHDIQIRNQKNDTLYTLE